MHLLSCLIACVQRFRYRNDKRRISLATTVYNRPDLVRKAIAYPIIDPRIDDIVIYDDGSKAANYQRMVALVGNRHRKISIIRCNKNAGPFTAKYKAVQACRNRWVVLLDSDNAINHRYVNRLYQLDKWSEDVLYCPDFSRPNFNFRIFAGEVIDFARAGQLLGQHNPRFVTTLLNTGNYFLPRDMYLRCLHDNAHCRITAGDVLVANYLWLKGGRRLKVLDRFPYNHLVHGDSNFKKRGAAQKVRIMEIRELIRQGSQLDFSQLFQDDLRS